MCWVSQLRVNDVIERGKQHIDKLIAKENNYAC